MSGATEVWPDRAYVPGRTPRHAEGAFDAVRDTAQAGMSVEQLAVSAAFCHGLRYLDAGFFWEAHEVFEPVWMALPDPSRERAFVQGLIQIANGFLKLRMERPKAAARLLGIAQALVLGPDRDAMGGVVMGVEAGAAEGLLVALERLVNDAV